MGREIRGHNGKKDIDRKAVESMKIDLVFKKTEGDGCTGDRDNAGIAQMREGYAVADSGRTKVLSNDQ